MKPWIESSKWIAVLTVQLLICGCSSVDFQAAAREPVGLDPRRPYIGAWEGNCEGPHGKSLHVQAVLSGEAPSCCGCPLGPEDYEVYLRATYWLNEAEDRFVLRKTEECNGATILRGRTVAPDPNNDWVFSVYGSAIGDTLTLAYGSGAKTNEYVMHLKRVTR